MRILISAKCDVDSFNLNLDSPLHISVAMGRRKLTKLLLDGGAMQFPNLKNETPLDIARRKDLKEIIDILRDHNEKLENSVQLQGTQFSSNPPNSSHKHEASKLKNPLWSPYGCHFYPDSRNFPPPKLETLPKEKLKKFEQYYLDLAGNIRKGFVLLLLLS